MATVVVVGTQWGDEGKGKITDYLAEKANAVVRYQGGNNAGHTICIGENKYKLHIVPSGIFYADKTCIIGNGVVIDPKVLVAELKYIHDNGFTTNNLKISDRAHVIMPYHIRLDEVEELRKGDNKIGTTKKGIGPAYMDKVGRIGIRMVDLMDKDTFIEKLERNLVEKNSLLEKVFGVEGFTIEQIADEYLGYAEELRQYVTDTSVTLNDQIDDGDKVLFEGAQGVMLDIDQGTYPFVTSSNPVAGGVCIGSGVGPTKINQVIGVAKAYTTRVGDGPFPTEQNNPIGDRIREIGKEYGTTTGRPRRVGWFDSVVLRHSRRVSGITGLSLNSIDVLTGLDTVKICKAYEYKGEVITSYPSSLKILAECKPIYEELPGWTEDITGVKAFEELPINAQNYLRKVEELIQIPIAIFSVGPNRVQTIMLKEVF